MTRPDDSVDTASRPAWSDHRVEQIIGRLLQAGVLIAASVVIVGGVSFLIHSGHTLADFRVFRDDFAELGTIPAIARRVVALDSRAIIQAGILLLIATPIARVALTLIAFGLQRDRLYVAITALVLVLLIGSLVWGNA